MTETLRDAIERSGLSYYRLAKDTGTSPIQISRFVRGERPDLRLSTVERLAEALGLELRPKDGD